MKKVFILKIIEKHIIIIIIYSVVEGWWFQGEFSWMECEDVEEVFNHRVDGGHLPRDTGDDGGVVQYWSACGHVRFSTLCQEIIMWKDKGGDIKVVVDVHPP